MVGGVPLIVRTIESAKKSKLINRIIVSTDDSEISEISEEFGAEIFEREEKLSNDEATSESVLLDVLEQLKNKENYIPDITVLLQCTSPFTIAEDIDGTIHSLIKNNANSAFSVSEFNHFLWREDNKAGMVGINHNEKINRKRRQDLKPQYLETGSIYIFLTAGFQKHKNRFFGKITIYKISQERVFEIDDPMDLAIAQKTYSILNIE